MWAKDTPNFIGNRIGLQSMMTTIHLMLERGLTPEDVDAITGIPMAHPKSATFRTADVVGLDTVGHVADELLQDADRRRGSRGRSRRPPYIAKMIEKGQLGDKTKGGFYKKQGDDIATLDPKTGEYRAKGGDAAIAKATQGARASIEDPRERVKQARRDARRRRRVRVDRAVALARVRGAPHPRDHRLDRGDRQRDEVGLRWELGPFETWDALGFAATVDRMKKDGLALPAWIDKMRAAGRHRASTPTAASGIPQRGDYAQRASRSARGDVRDHAQGRRAGAQERGRRGVGSRRRRARPDVQDQGELDRRRRRSR